MKKGKAKHMYIHRLTPSPVWQLRFRHNSKLLFLKSFSDAEYGSKDIALAAALERRDVIAAALGITHKIDCITHEIDCKTEEYRKNQKKMSGIAGVSYLETRNYRYYRASINLKKHKQTSRYFNLDTLGNLEALKQAIAQRKEWEEQLLNNQHDITRTP